MKNIPSNQNFGVFFSFSQLLTCIIAFVQDVEKKLQKIMPDMPVFVLQSGDTNYYLDSKFNEPNSEQYERIPRFVISFDSSPEIVSDSFTNSYNRYKYALDVLPDNGSFPDEVYTETFSAVVRRVQIDVPIKATMVSSNFVYALRHYEALLSIFTRENAFSYTHHGAVYNAAYTNDNDQSMDFPQMDHTGNRNFVQYLNIKLQTHIYVPRVETIIEYEKLQDKDFSISLSINSETSTTNKIKPFSINDIDMSRVINATSVIKDSVCGICSTEPNEHNYKPDNSMISIKFNPEKDEIITNDEAFEM